MKAVLLLLGAALCCAAQFREIQITFQGVGCASCTESLASRMQRIRGVESAVVNAERGVLTVRLAERNRVRLEQIRDFVEQDGTKATRAVVEVAGDLRETDGEWSIQPDGSGASYAVRGGKPAGAGRYVVRGEVTELKPASGAIGIHATELIKK